MKTSRGEGIVGGRPRGWERDRWRPSVRAAAGTPIFDHQEDFRQCLLAKGTTAEYVTTVDRRARRIIAECHFASWSDISANQIQQYLARLRDGSEAMSAQTFDFYLQAIKQFCRWMVRERRAIESPVEHLTGLNVRTDGRHDRRSLEPDEMRTLLGTTVVGPKRFSMTGCPLRQNARDSSLLSIRLEGKRL